MILISKIINKFMWHLGGGKQKAAEFARQRELHQQHCYDFPSECNGWKKVGDKPVYGNSETGTVFDPYVMLYEDHFLMVASERKTGNLILLKSSDGVNWGNKTTILSHQPTTWEHIVNRGCLLFVNNVWHLWYTGQNKGVSVIGHATSVDGIRFSRSKCNPVLRSTMSSEGVSVMNPCVLWNENRQIFQMWYSAGENYEPDAIFYAESDDGETWTKHTGPVLTKFPEHEWEKFKIGGCDVKRLPDRSYIIHYIGYQNLDVTRVCFATSNDGISWIRPNDNICISPSRSSWDGDATYKPAVEERDGKLFLWYNGRKGENEYIGLAVKE